MSIKELLEKQTNLKVILKIGDYKSTFIRFVRDRFNLKISLHKLFLDAPDNIKHALLSRKYIYIIGDTCERQSYNRDNCDSWCSTTRDNNLFSKYVWLVVVVQDSFLNTIYF